MINDHDYKQKNILYILYTGLLPLSSHINKHVWGGFKEHQQVKFKKKMSSFRDRQTQKQQNKQKMSVYLLICLSSYPSAHLSILVFIYLSSVNCSTSSPENILYQHICKEQTMHFPHRQNHSFIHRNSNTPSNQTAVDVNRIQSSDC